MFDPALSKTPQQVATLLRLEHGFRKEPYAGGHISRTIHGQDMIDSSSPLSGYDLMAGMSEHHTK